MAQLAAHRVLQAMARCGLGHPLCRFFVRSHQQRGAVVCGDQVRQERRAAQHQGVAGGQRFVQGGDAVQMGIDCDDSVKQCCQELAHDTLTDGFAWLERDVLAHIRQIRRQQRQVLCTQAARGLGYQQQFKQFFVRLGQASEKYQTLWQ